MKSLILLALLMSLPICDTSAKIKKTKKEQVPATELSSPDTITIKGKVAFTYKGYWNYPAPQPEFKMTVYRQEGTGRKVFAEAEIGDNNEYTLRLPVNSVGVYTVDCGHWQSVQIWAEDENLEIDFRGYDTARIKIKNPPYVYIRGGVKNEIMNQYNFCAYRNYQGMIAVSRAAYQSGADEGVRKKISGELYEYLSNEYKARVRYIAEHNAATTSVLALLPAFNPDADKEFIESVLSRLEAAHPEYAPIQEYREQVAQDKAQRERLDNGNPAPAFAYPQLDGTPLALSDLKGKIVLVDFWASWCGPCRKEIVNLKKYYEEFKDKGVEFLSVSIDADDAAWRKAAAEEDMPWLQIHATDGGKQVMSDYRFNGIPHIVLIDAQGNLYAKNLRGDAIRETIQKALDGVAPEKPAPRKSISISAISM